MIGMFFLVKVTLVSLIKKREVDLLKKILGRVTDFVTTRKGMWITLGIWIAI